jgi:hypothetical protein
MALLAVTRGILEKVEEKTHVPVQVLSDSSLPVPARVRMARDQMRAHVVVINPTNTLADYYVAFAAASILRLYDTKAEDRYLFGESGSGLRQLEQAPPPAGLLEFPPEVRKQYLASIHAGLLTQLRSQPLGLRIALWLKNEYPELADAQADGIAAEQRDATQALAPQVRTRAPAQVFVASMAMNAAVALHSDRLLAQKLFSIPYPSGHLERGAALLKVADEIPGDPNHDRELIDAWAAQLGLTDWIDWVPFVPPRMIQ